MLYLLDTNIIIRFLVGDHQEHLAKSITIFKDIESAKLQVEISDSVLMEAFFVLTKFYKLPKNEVINDLKTKLAFNPNFVIEFVAVSFMLENLWLLKKLKAYHKSVKSKLL